MKEAGVRLKQLRRKKEITQEQVAAELNISVDTLRKNEQGIRGMSVELLDIYADYYNVDITSMKEVPEQLRKLRRQYLRYQQAEIIYSTDDDIARYSVMHGNEQLFASKYKLYLPTEEELKAEIETQKAMFYLQQKESEEQELE